MSVHQKVSDLLPFYLKGKVDASRQQLIEKHLANCPACRLALSEWQTIAENVVAYQTTLQQATQLPPLVLPPAVPEIPSQSDQLPASSGSKSNSIRNIKGKVTVNHNNEPEPTGKTSQLSHTPWRSWRQGFVGGMLTTSLVALLILLVTSINRPEVTPNATPTASQGQVGRVVGMPISPTTIVASTNNSSQGVTPTLTALAAPPRPLSSFTLTMAALAAPTITPSIRISQELTAAAPTIAPSIRISQELTAAAIPTITPTIRVSTPSAILTPAPTSGTAFGTTAPTPTVATGQGVSFAGNLKITIEIDFERINYNGLELSPDGTTIALSEQGIVKLYKTADGSLINTVEIPADFRSLSSRATPVWSPDSKTLAIAYHYSTFSKSDPNSWAGDNSVIEFLSATGNRQLRLENFNEEIRYIAWSPDGKFLATGNSFSDEHSGHQASHIRLWGRDGKLVRILEGGTLYALYPIAWSPDSQLLVVSRNGVLRFWQTDGKLLTELSLQEDGKPLSGLPFEGVGAADLVWSPNSKLLAVNIHGTTSGSEVRLYDMTQVKSGQLQAWRILRGHTNIISSLVWSPDSLKLASSSHDRTARLWDVASAKPIAEIPIGTQYPVLAWSPDGKLVALVAANKQIQIVDSAGKLVKTIEEKGPIFRLVWLPSGQGLLSASEADTINIWQR